MLDIRTLLLNTGLAAIYAALAMLFVWRVHPREPAVRYWGGAFLTIAAGALLIGLRGRLPDVWSVLIGNLGVIAGSWLMQAGTAIFVRRPVPWRFAGAVVAAAALAFWYWGLVAPSYVLRGLVFSLAAGLAWIFTVADLLHAARGRQRTLHLAVAALFALCIAATAVRAIDAQLNAANISLFQGGALHVTWFAAAQAVIFFSPFGFLLLTSQRLQQRLDRLANEDALTGVLNRRAFLAQALDLLASRPTGQGGALLVLDLDHFKQLNDRHGHAAGDAVLRGFARTVAAQLRTEDLFARVGGEEFWLLLPGVDRAGAAQVAERLRAAVAAQKFAAGSQHLQATVSVGVSAVELGDIAGALAAADRALYAAKAQGRNRVVIA